MQNVNYLGTGEFGKIYEGPKGAAAEVFMLENKSGEIRNAFHHKSIGDDIDLFCSINSPCTCCNVPAFKAANPKLCP